MADKDDSAGRIAVNRRARYDYFIEERFEAGVALQGWEVKALRAGRLQLRAKSWIGKKTDLAGARPLERADLVDQYFLLADDAAAKPGRDLRERERPGHVILRRRAACLPSP